MAISPKRNNEWAEEMRRIYADAELRMLEKIARRIARGIEDENWQEAKLAELRKHRDEVNRIIKELREVGPEALERSVIRGYLAGMLSADSDLDHLGVDLPQGRITEDIDDTGSIEALMKFGMVNVGAVKKLAEATTDNLDSAHLQILRNANDAYRKVIQEVVGSGVVGADTRRQVAQRALARYAGSGIGSFQDRSGRNWDIASYTEMATRTAIGNAQIEGHISRMQEQGRDLVIVSDHPEECSTCAPWERQVLSISGDDNEHKSLRYATSDGLFHPNCGHTINAYIEGLTTDVGNGDSDEGGYEKRQKQRHLERQVRKWKKRGAVAITDEEKRFTNAKIRQWQKGLREFTSEHDRRRRYDRESINKPAPDSGIGAKSKIGKMLKADDRKIQAMIAMNARDQEEEGHSPIPSSGDIVDVPNKSKIVSVLGNASLFDDFDPEENGQVTQALYDRLGIAGKPSVVDKISDDHYIQFRGIAGDDRREIFDQMKNGEMWSSAGTSGNGINLAYGREKESARVDVALEFATGGGSANGLIMVSSLSNDAKRIRYEDLDAYIEKFNDSKEKQNILESLDNIIKSINPFDAGSEDEGRKLMRKQGYFNELKSLVSTNERSIVAILNGYDAIDSEVWTETSVFNRTKLIIEENSIEVNNSNRDDVRKALMDRTS